MVRTWCGRSFLSSNAQDFIEDGCLPYEYDETFLFLSSNAQDFIEDVHDCSFLVSASSLFLSSNAQDFIEEKTWPTSAPSPPNS